MQILAMLTVGAPVPGGSLCFANGQPMTGQGLLEAWLETLPVAPFKHAHLTDIRGIVPFLFFKIFF